MIKIESTPNLAGVKISGSFDDLYELVEVFYDIRTDEFSDKHHEYMRNSSRLLGLSFEKSTRVINQLIKGADFFILRTDGRYIFVIKRIKTNESKRNWQFNHIFELRRKRRYKIL